MGLALCLGILICAAAISRRSLGNGLGFTLAVGCIYGWLRANFLDGVTHFCFDAALCGLYAGTIPRLRPRQMASSRALLKWTIVLTGWPLFVILLKPHFSMRSRLCSDCRTSAMRVLFVPLILLGDNWLAKVRDTQILTTWAQWCVLGASGFAIAEVVFGLELFFPFNQVDANHLHLERHCRWILSVTCLFHFRSCLRRDNGSADATALGAFGGAEGKSLVDAR